MKKRRITLNLDADVVAALESAGGRSLSDSANRALREATDAIAHRQALANWLDELDARHGPPAPEDYAAADRVLDEAFGSSRADVAS